MWLALWITEQLAAHFNRDDIEAATVCNTLRVGVRDNQTVVSILSLSVVSRPFDQIDTFWTGREAPEKPMLYVVHEPDGP